MLARQFIQGVSRQGLRVGASRLQARVFKGHFKQKQIQGQLVFQILFFLSHLDFVQGGLRNIDVTALDQLGHLSIKESEQQRANVRTVHIRIGHDDDAVVAQFVDIKVVCARLTRLGAYFANAGAKRSDEG